MCLFGNKLVINLFAQVLNVISSEFMTEKGFVVLFSTLLTQIEAIN